MSQENPTPGRKLMMAVLIALLLAIPLFTVYLLVYDRQSQSETARASIAEGWGGPQTIAGPVLVLPYQEQVTETVTEGGRQVARTNTVWRELTLAPEQADLRTDLTPERRKRSIYEAVVYEATASGTARFALPTDLARLGITADRLSYDRAELRFGLKDARGLFGTPPSVSIDGRRLVLQPGKGSPATGGSGFFTWLDAASIRERPMTATFNFAFRGNGWLALAPQAGDTRWTVTSKWPHPSFQGGFLPTTHKVSDEGFTAMWRVGNLALGRSLVSNDAAQPDARAAVGADRYMVAAPAGDYEARVDLVSPVDLYSQVNRSVKYGFLFIGFTFMAFLMFDVIAGVRVATVEYLLVGAGLVLFFVMLLAFAEVIGFAAAYVLAAAAIIGLLTAYSAAVLKSWRRGGYVAGLLAALYGVLYILLSLEAYSLLIGSILLFAALAGIMYLTRNLDWSGLRTVPQSTDG
ncbi:cell envelope integrity protein CreD [Sphingomonas sp. SUN019]|uniref:cell envelope integrity protein CreD n=1 Tax=Sphingomonas sp. SUN019 TaxID=2937788 RepID=UPI002164C9FE|nr:cell envelope integrity protein CreD [Sphingomonas sp. SUN019]UVO49616.1 cell envelope integrity protein CreD [Sphingomonas sp. SUN019]